MMEAVGFLLLGQLSQFIRFNRLLLIGMLVTAVGLFMTSLSRNYYDVLIWFSLVTGLGFGAATFCCFATSIYDAYEKRGFSTGWNSAMRIAGGAVFFVGLRWSIERVFGLSGTFIVLSAIIAFGGILGYFLASREKSAIVWFRLDRSLVWFYISVSLCFGIFSMQITHKLPLLKEAGLGVGSLGILALIGLWVNASTEPVAGWLFIDKIKNSRFSFILAVIAVIAGNLLLIPLVRGLEFVWYAVLCGLFALFPEPIVPMVNYLADKHRNDLGALLGTTFFFMVISQALFSWFGGIFYVWLGSYELIILLTSVIGIASVFMLRK